jgi:hypothetical protein
MPSADAEPGFFGFAGFAFDRIAAGLQNFSLNFNVSLMFP